MKCTGSYPLTFWIISQFVMQIISSLIHTHTQTHMCVLLIGLSVLTAPVSAYVAKT